MKNLQMIIVKYLEPTNANCARIKLIDTRFKASVVLERDTGMDVLSQSTEYIKSLSFNIVGFSCTQKQDYIMIDNFKSIREPKNVQ